MSGHQSVHPAPAECARTIQSNFPCQIHRTWNSRSFGQWRKGCGACGHGPGLVVSLSHSAVPLVPNWFLQRAVSGRPVLAGETSARLKRECHLPKWERNMLLCFACGAEPSPPPDLATLFSTYFLDCTVWYPPFCSVPAIYQCIYLYPLSCILYLSCSILFYLVSILFLCIFVSFISSSFYLFILYLVCI